MVAENDNPMLMDSTSISTSRFRFRDHNQDLVDGETSEGHSSSDSSSVSSNEDEEPELQSMTAQGVQHLCSELLELKQESNEDFQKNIFSNYSAFLGILKEMESLHSEMSGLKRQAFFQKRLIQDLNGGISLHFLLDKTIKSNVEEMVDLQPPSSKTLETHSEEISEILDTLLLEHRLDDALSLLESEGDGFQDLQSREKFSSDQLMSYHSIVSEKRAMLSDQFRLVAENPRVSALELHKALVGLCRLGNFDISTQLLIQYYHMRIASGIHDMQNSKFCLNVLYIQELAKYTCSMILQALTSFAALNGDSHPYPSELSEWINEEIRVFASYFKKYIASVSEISRRLSIAIDAMQIVMPYFSLLEKQRIFLLPSLIEHIRPYMEEIFHTHIGHLSEVISIFTSIDTWILGRYSVSGILTGRNYVVLDQQPEYLFLTNSGRKFATLIQSTGEEIFHLIPLQIESSLLKGIMDLFTAYIVILERALVGDGDAIQEDVLRINTLESPTQGIQILANLSMLMQFSTSIIRNIFDGIHQLEFEIDKYERLVHDIYHRLKSSFIMQFISNIFSSNFDHECGSEIPVNFQNDSRSYDLIPSVPYIELYLELKKVQKLTEDCIDANWLVDMLKEIIDSTFEWISRKCNTWEIEKGKLADRRAEYLQFMLDMQFLVQNARFEGYLSDNVMKISSDIASRLEKSFISTGLSPPRVSDDNDEWLANAAIRAIQKLQELHATDSLQNDDLDTVKEEEESQHCASSDTTTDEADVAVNEDPRTEDSTCETLSTLFKKELDGYVETEDDGFKLEEKGPLEMVRKMNDSESGDNDLYGQIDSCK